MSTFPKTPPLFVDPQSGDTFSFDQPRWRAPNKNPLMLTTLDGLRRTDIDTSKRSIWRYAHALPTKIEDPISLGEGCTPLVEGQFSGANCKFKLEWFSPTGSFKDRGASVLMSFVRQQGINEVIEDSSGNGGAAIAAYGAAAGMAVKILVPAYTQPAKIAQIRAYGAEVILVPGPREATEAAAIEMADEIFYASHNWHPMFLQGTKSLGYEIWEDLGFNVPDNLVIPAGAGSNVLGCYIAFRELMASGETDRMPKIFVSQPENCAPIHHAVNPDELEGNHQSFAPTVAEGTAIKKPIRLQEMLQAIHETGGTTVAITEEEIIAASLTLAQSGIYIEPTCAHAAAGMKHLTDKGYIKPDQETVVVLTGSGLKATFFYADQFEAKDT